MHNELIKETVQLPSGVSAAMQGNAIHLKGPKGEQTRNVATKRVQIKVEGNHIIIESKNATKNDKCILETNTAHIRNMVRGVHTGHVYKLKICSGHFPMSVALKGNDFVVTNFIGEKVPRKLAIKPGVKVNIAGTDITVESHSKELAGGQAAAIELLTRRPGFDSRVFQDGIYIVEKDGKKV
jgi:large subunit ribosomal protein L6